MRVTHLWVCCALATSGCPSTATQGGPGDGQGGDSALAGEDALTDASTIPLDGNDSQANDARVTGMDALSTTDAMNRRDTSGGTDVPPVSDTTAGSDGNADAPAVDNDASSTGVWVPNSSGPIHFHWQLSDTFDPSRDEVPGNGDIVYDIDGENNTAATVTALHALGPNVRVICYVDVGTYEPGRSDDSSFPSSVLGSNVQGWPGERWVDVRQQSVLLPIMMNRFVNWCMNKGFDGIEPDNLDGFENCPGFPFTEDDEMSYVTAIAQMAHTLSTPLSIGVKNLVPDVTSQHAAQLASSFDWSLSEQCYEYNECGPYAQAFAANGKANFDVEYNQAPNCTDASSLQINAQQRDLDLVAPTTNGYLYQPCIPDSQTVW